MRQAALSVIMLGAAYMLLEESAVTVSKAVSMLEVM